MPSFEILLWATKSPKPFSISNRSVSAAETRSASARFAVSNLEFKAPRAAYHKCSAFTSVLFRDLFNCETRYGNVPFCAIIRLYTPSFFYTNRSVLLYNIQDKKSRLKSLSTQLSASMIRSNLWDNCFNWKGLGINREEFNFRLKYFASR